jgi:flavin reductase (DIM6/NTAB) family NADH-FMN oxidoreductase RutF
MAFRTILPEQLSPLQAGALLTGGVGPRPIALASTRSLAGVRNLAPFSFFNAFGSNPPMVAFAPNRRGRDGSVKHTYLNAVATREFVIAAVSHAMVQQMNVASAEYPEGVDEFVKAGLTGSPALRVKPDLVAESPFQMECRLHQVVELGAGPGSGLLLVGEVVAFHAREDCWEDATPSTPDAWTWWAATAVPGTPGPLARRCSSCPSRWAIPSATTPCRSRSGPAPSSPATTWAAWPTAPSCRIWAGLSAGRAILWTCRAWSGRCRRPCWRRICRRPGGWRGVRLRDGSKP